MNIHLIRTIAIAVLSASLVGAGGEQQSLPAAHDKESALFAVSLSAPTWSADGRYISFIEHKTSKTGGTDQVRVLEVGSGQLTEVSVETSQGNVQGIAWRGNSGELVYAVNGPDGSQVRGFRLSDNSTKTLATFNRKVGSISVSPAQDKLALIFAQPNPAHAVTIVSLPKNGAEPSSPLELAETPVALALNPYYIRWSSTGDSLIVNSARKMPDNSTKYSFLSLSYAPEVKFRVLFEAEAGEFPTGFAISPDSGTCAVASVDKNHQQLSVRLVDLVGSSAKTIKTFSDTDVPVELCWSPDGARLAFTRGGRLGTWDVTASVDEKLEQCKKNIEAISAALREFLSTSGGNYPYSLSELQDILAEHEQTHAIWCPVNDLTYNYIRPATPPTEPVSIVECYQHRGRILRLMSDGKVESVAEAK